MKLHVLSDLHIEFGDFEPPATDADVVVLAGDIGVGLQGIHWAAERFASTPVIYVAGNHEFYRHDIALLDELKHGLPAHVHVLENDRVEFEGVRFLGCSLWSDFALFGEAERLLAMRKAAQCMNDFALIRNGGRLFTPGDARRLHAGSRDWLAARLAEPFAGRTVVVTHHAPSIRSVPGRFDGDLLSAAFASDLEAMLDADHAALWIHGHLHDSFDYEIRGARVLCNPRGYTPDALNPAFRPGCVVEI